MPIRLRPTHAIAFALALGTGASLATPAAAVEALLVIEAESGRVLFAENATYPWYPASVTKLMTTYVTLRAVKDRRIALDTLLTFSDNAVAQRPSKMGFKAGTQVTVDNALKMLMVKSANDIAVVLAEGVSGSIENFANDMNKAALRLGMTQTSYVNPNGLPADDQITSARDLAILARALIREFPEYDFYWHIPAIQLGKKVMRNYNTLIDRYQGADGMKTGFICASGFNLVASATRNGRRLIAVVLGSPSSPVRAQKAAQLLEKGFNTTSVLSWLTPSLGTVDALVPIAAAPPNLREEMCGPNRRRPAAESDEGETATNTPNAADPDQIFAVTAGHLRDGGKHAALLGPPVSSGAPIPVWIGPSRTQPSMVATKKQTVRTATAPTAGRPGAPSEQATPKPRQAKVAPSQKTKVARPGQIAPAPLPGGAAPTATPAMLDPTPSGGVATFAPTNSGTWTYPPGYGKTPPAAAATKPAQR